MNWFLRFYFSLLSFFMQRIIIIGCGVIGAMIAYELSFVPQVQITVLDRQQPAQASTGAALGVLMGIISQKKGRAWAMRQDSIRRYATLIPELETAIGRLLPQTRGILKLLSDADWQRWQDLIQLRQAQGWLLELWPPEQVQTHCPQVQYPALTAAIYSPQDGQVDPTALTLALIEAAQQRGVNFHFEVEVQPLRVDRTYAVATSAGEFAADSIVVTAGLGSTPLVKQQDASIQLQPVLGQALQVRLPAPLSIAFEPVITGHDIHIVPLRQADPTATDRDYWIGATVQFPVAGEAAVADAASLETVWQNAIGLCPDLKSATVIKTWSGLRPRPDQRPAPIVEPLKGSDNVIVATGHYRNGVLLAPATAQIVRSLLF